MLLLERIADEAGLPKHEVSKIAMTANYRYQSYRIPKKTSGYRTIAHPTPELKFLQRWLNRNVFGSLKVHERALGYRLGVGIAENARVHARK